MIPMLRRRIYGHVDILLPVGYRQRFDADFLEPVIIEYRISGDKLASSLTFGQFVKAIAFSGTLYRHVGATSDTVDGTRLACLVSGLYGDRRLIAILLLGATTIHEDQEEGGPSTFAECIALLG